MLNENNQKESDSVHINMVNDFDNLTASEVRDIKLIVSNYRVAKYGIIALVTFGSLITAIMHIVDYIPKK